MITPSNLTLSKDKKLLTVTFENTDYSLTSEYLRVYSPSAEVQGHGPGPVSYTHLTLPTKA